MDIVCDTITKHLDNNRIITGKYVNCHKCGYSECNNCNKYVGKNHKCFMKKIKTEGGHCTVDSNKPCKSMIQLKRKIGVIRVEPTQRNTYLTISKQPKTLKPTPLISQLHKTSMVESTYITVLRNSATVF